VGKGSNSATIQRVPIREKERIVNIAGRWRGKMGKGKY
jgi:hypothetical protein